MGTGNRIKRIAFWIVSFLLPIALLCVVCEWGSVYPFGDNSFLTEDLKYQYIDFFTWYRRVLTGQESIYYSFAQGMGANTWGLYSYYLASPFNLLILLFSEDKLTLAIFVIDALKVGCIQLAMTWYLHRRFRLSRAWAAALALGFSWGSWVVTDLRNPLWLDALIILPLAAWQCRQLIYKGRWVPLALLTMANIVCCWYMAYMSILFLCFFVLFELVLYLQAGNKVSARWVLGRAGRFTVALVFGLLLAAWTFVPTVLSMGGTANTNGISGLTHVPFSRLVRGLIPCMWNLNYVPQFYCGLVVELLALLFLFCRKVPLRTRVTVLLFTVFLAFGSWLQPLEYIWCGFRMPNGFYSRSAWSVSFMLIWMAGGFVAAAKPKFRALPYGLLVLLAVELSLNAHTSFNLMYTGYSQGHNDAYRYEDAAQTANLEAKADSTFYRVEKTYNRAGAAFNEALSAGYNALSTYTSASNPKAVAFLNALGYSSRGEFSSVYAAPILATDSLLGVRYVSCESDVPLSTPIYNIRFSGITSMQGAWYENPYALPLGFAVTAGTQVDELNEDANPFECQNELFSSLTGSDTTLYTKIEAQPTTNADGSVSWQLEVPAGCIGYTYLEIPEDSDTNYPAAVLNVDGADIANEGWRFSHNVRALSTEAETDNTAHTVTLKPYGDATSIDPEQTYCIFYALNVEAFTQTIDSLASNGFDPEAAAKNSVEGTIEVDESSKLMLSIPYDSGWSVQIDGNVAELHSAFDGGMSFIELSAGKHSISMSYHSPGAVFGQAISAAAAIALAGGYFYAKIRRKANICAPEQEMGRL